LRRAAIGAVFTELDAVPVEGMRGYAVLGDLMHALGADLQLDPLMARADNGRVDRLIVVLLRRRYVVLEAPGNGAPGGVHDAEHAIAGIEAVDHDPEPIDVGELLERDLPVLHLAPDGERLLLATVDLCIDPGLRELPRQVPVDLLDQAAVARTDVRQ